MYTTYSKFVNTKHVVIIQKSFFSPFQQFLITTTTSCTTIKHKRVRAGRSAMRLQWNLLKWSLWNRNNLSTLDKPKGTAWFPTRSNRSVSLKTDPHNFEHCTKAMAVSNKSSENRPLRSEQKSCPPANFVKLNEQKSLTKWGSWVVILIKIRRFCTSSFSLSM